MDKMDFTKYSDVELAIIANVVYEERVKRAVKEKFMETLYTLEKANPDTNYVTPKNPFGV